MCKNSETVQNCRFQTARGPLHWWHGLRALACAGRYDFGTGQSRPRSLACGAPQQWRTLCMRCSGWIECLWALQARGVTRLWPGKPLVYSIAVARHTLTHRSKVQRSRSPSYKNRHGSMVASHACCHGRVLLLPAWVCMPVWLPMFSSCCVFLLYRIKNCF